MSVLQALRLFGWNALAAGATLMLALWQLYAHQSALKIGINTGLLGFWLYQAYSSRRQVLTWAVLHYLASATSPRRAIDIAQALGEPLGGRSLQSLLEAMTQNGLLERLGADPAVALYQLQALPVAGVL